MTIQEFVTKWVFHSDDHEVDELGEKLDHISHRVGLIAAFELAEVVHHWAESIGEMGEQLESAAYAAGVTAEELQKLQYGAAQTGTKAEDVSQAMQKMSRTLYEAKTGGKEATEAFRQIGITPEQLRGFRDSRQALGVISDRFKAIHDPIKKAALMQQVFGRGGARMALWVSQGSKKLTEFGKSAEEMGAVLGEEDVEKLAGLQKSLEMLGQVVKTFSGTLVADMAPSIRSAIKYWLEWYAANRKVIEINFKEWSAKFLYTLGYVMEGVREVGDAIIKFVGEHKELFHVIMNVVGAFILTAIAVGAVKKGFGLAADAFKFLTSPATVMIGLLMVIIVAFKSLYDMLFNHKSFEDTWMGQMLGPYAKKLGDLAKTFGFVDDTNTYEVGPDGKPRPKARSPEEEEQRRVEDSKLRDDQQKQREDKQSFDALMSGNTALPEGQQGGGLGEIARMFQGMSQSPGAAIGGAGINLDQLMAANNMAQGGGSMLLPPQAPPQAPQNPSNTTTVNAPVTINVSGGADPNAVKHGVKEAVRDHLDKVHRQAARNLRPAKAY